MQPVDLLPNYFDPKPKDFGSNKVPGGLGQRQSSHTEDGFIAAEKRAEHWLGVWSGFWERQRSWL